jgi:hypothetical protein
LCFSWLFIPYFIGVNRNFDEFVAAEHCQPDFRIVFQTLDKLNGVTARCGHLAVDADDQVIGP